MEKLIYKEIKMHTIPLLMLVIIISFGFYITSSSAPLSNSSNSFKNILMTANFKLTQNNEGNFKIIQNNPTNSEFNFMNIGQLTGLEISLTKT